MEDGGEWRWTEEDGDGRRRMEMDGGGWRWTEEDGDGRRRMEMDGGGWRWTEEDGYGRRRVEVDGGGRRWTEVDGGGRRWTEMDGDGRRRMEEDGGGWRRMEEDGGGWRRMEEKWKDNGEIIMGFDGVGIHPERKVKRWSSMDKKKVDIPSPASVLGSMAQTHGIMHTCNQPSILSTKWWSPLSTFLLQTTMLNAYQQNGGSLYPPFFNRQQCIM